MSGVETIQLVIVIAVAFLSCLLVLVVFLWNKLEKLELSGSFSLELLKCKINAELKSKPSS